MSKEMTLPMAIHFAAVAPAIAIGITQMFMQKGTRIHKLLGWLWVIAMAVAVVSSFWIYEIRKGAGFSVIHLLSVWTLISMSAAIWFIRRGKVRAHKGFMVGTLLGLGGGGAHAGAR